MVLGLAGLFLSSRVTDLVFYWTGVATFAVAALAIFELIRINFDQAEGKPTDRARVTPVILVLVAVGSVLFHAVSPWWWAPIASNWQYIDDTIVLTFWITGLVFVAILLFLAYCVYRFRHQAGRRAAYEPESTRLEWWLTAGTAVGVAAMLAPGLVVWGHFVTVPDDASEVEIVGQQWQWSYRFPGEDNRLGRSSTTLISAENPLGIDPDDPHAGDDVVVEGEHLRLPIGKPVKVLLRSVDVLHDFYVPELRAKMDMIPGMVTYFWITPTRTGTFEAICAELCGVGHPQMRGGVVIEDETSHRAWLQQRPTFAQLTSRRYANAGGKGLAKSEMTVIKQDMR
jgi:cytochrome c oxidase subunit 2